MSDNSSSLLKFCRDIIFNAKLKAAVLTIFVVKYCKVFKTHCLLVEELQISLPGKREKGKKDS